jgi:choline dehydrogenase-like flavoprotein
LGLKYSKILLIEAGPAAPDELRINVPGMKGSTLGTVYDWNLTTVAQTGLKNRVLAQARGKVLGGSSALNLMTYNRAAKVEYDSWGELGNAGWNWNALIAAMVKSETLTNYPGTTNVGKKGPVKATINRYIPSHQDNWIPALQSLGIPHTPDSVTGTPIGVSYQPSSIDPAIYNRSYSANAYLPIAGSNLKVMTSTKVVKINLMKVGTSQRATGVTLENGTVIAASREVIISAGTFLSPGLLELSGIGQTAVLTAAGVTPVINLPGVGEGLQDHTRVQSSYQLKDNYTSFDKIRSNATYAAQQLDLWKAKQFSHYDYTGSAYSFLNWDQATNATATLKALASAVADPNNVVDQQKLKLKSNPKVPQLEVIFSDGYTGLKGYPAAGTPLFGKGFFSLIAGVMHPMARGNVHINPADKLGKPLIDPKYASNEHDIQALVEAMKTCRKMALTEPIRSSWVSEYEPGLDVVQTDAQWREYVLNTTLTFFHPVGTCPMLPKAQGGVVGPNLKVYGTTNLRVADASIIPMLVSAHIQTAVYGIAEIASSLIISDSYYAKRSYPIKMD